MANTWAHQKEGPDDHHSSLVHDAPIRRWSELGDIDCESIKRSRGHQEAQAVEHYRRALLYLLWCQVYVVQVPIYALNVIKGASNHLSGNEQHKGDDYAEDALPAHQIQSFLASRSGQDVFFQDSMGCVKELAPEQSQHADDKRVLLLMVLRCHGSIFC